MNNNCNDNYDRIKKKIEDRAKRKDEKICENLYNLCLKR